MLVQCTQCGAPLDVAGDTRYVKCGYCDRTNEIKRMKTIAQAPPPNWAPPTVWTPPAEFKAPNVALSYHGSRARRTKVSSFGCCIGIFTTVLPIAIVGFVQLQIHGGLPSIFGWDGQEPFRCGGNDTITIEDVRANLPGRTAITVEANCEVRIINSHIVAGEGIRATGNRSVIIENSTIEAGNGIWASINKRIELTNSTVVASGVAIHGDINAEIYVNGGRVEGAVRAFELEMNATATVNGTTVIGPSVPADRVHGLIAPAPPGGQAPAGEVK